MLMMQPPWPSLTISRATACRTKKTPFTLREDERNQLAEIAAVMRLVNCAHAPANESIDPSIAPVFKLSVKMTNQPLRALAGSVFTAKAL